MSRFAVGRKTLMREFDSKYHNQKDFFNNLNQSYEFKAKMNQVKEDFNKQDLPISTIIH